VKIIEDLFDVNLAEYTRRVLNTTGDCSPIAFAAKWLRDSCYGENRHQSPSKVYVNPGAGKHPMSLVNFTQVTGKPPSWANNFDMYRLSHQMVKMAANFDANFGHVPCIMIIDKHGQPCGCGVANSPEEATTKAIRGHRDAAFGGSVAANFLIGENIAKLLNSYEHKPSGKLPRRMLDQVAAPGVTRDAVKALRRKSEQCRIWTNPDMLKLSRHTLSDALVQGQLWDGVQFQPANKFILTFDHPQMRSFGDLSLQQAWDMCTAEGLGSRSNSNTVTIVKDGTLLGNGVALVHRALAFEVAGLVSYSAGRESVEGSVVYSDSFFPFPDGPLALAKAKIAALFSTFGDEGHWELLKLLEAAGISVRALPDAIARGFFGHY
jgi:phosphoribosylaminoimidazolecarboxamide formyltransferase/IMP cyclohydrolase